jgi:hypothetical protein
VARLQTLIPLIALLVAGSLPVRGRAQSPPAPQPDTSLRNAVARLGEDSKRTVRIASRGTGRIEGKRVSLIGDSVSLNTDSGVRTIALDKIDSVWIQHGTAAPIIGIIAAVPCAVFAAMVGGFIGGDPDSKGSPTRELVGIVGGLVGGALVCGSVGAAVGSSIRRWRLEYPRHAT